MTKHITLTFRSLVAGCFIFAIIMIAAWPRPELRIEVPVTEIPRICYWYNEEQTTTPIIRCIGHDDSYWFMAYRNDQWIESPRFPDKYRILCCSTAGYFVLLEDEEYRGFQPATQGFSLYCYTMGEARTPPVLSFTEKDLLDLIVSQDGSTAIVFRGGDDQPLRIQSYALPSGRLIAEATLLDRRGTLHRIQKQLATWSVELTADGSRLFLTTGWDGARRTTTSGIEEYDTATLQKVRTYAVEGLHRPHSTSLPIEVLGQDFGTTSLSLERDEQELEVNINRRVLYKLDKEWNRADVNSQTLRLDRKTGKPVQVPHGYGAKDESLGGTMIDRTPDERLTVWLDEKTKRLTLREDSEPPLHLRTLRSFTDIHDGGTCVTYSPDQRFLAFDQLHLNDEVVGWFAGLLDRLGWAHASRPSREVSVTDRVTRETTIFTEIWQDEVGYPHLECLFRSHQLYLLSTKNTKNGPIMFEIWNLPKPNPPWLWASIAGCLSALIWRGVAAKRMRST